MDGVVLNSRLVKPSNKKTTDLELVKSSENSSLLTSRAVETPEDSVTAESSEGVALEIYTAEHSEERVILDLTKDSSLLDEDGFIDLDETSSRTDRRADQRDAEPDFLKDCKIKEAVRLRTTNKENCKQLMLDSLGTKQDVPKDILDLETCEKLDVVPEVNKSGSSPTNKTEATLDADELNKDKLIEFYLSKDKNEPKSTDDSSKTEIKEEGNRISRGINLTLSSSHSHTTDVLTGQRAEPDSCSAEGKELLPDIDSAAAAEEENKESEGSLASSLMSHSDNKSEIRLWLLKRIQVPIEGMPVCHPFT